MDERQKAKVWRRVLLLTKDQEIAELARQHFCPSHLELSPSEFKPTTKGSERISRVFDLTALACALGGWWYTVVNPEPNFYLGSLLLFGTICFLWAALWTYADWTIKGRIISGLLALIVFGGIDFLWHRQRIAVAKVTMEKAQAADRKEVSQFLSASMDYGIGDDPTLSTFVYSNGSSLPITLDDVSTTTIGIKFLLVPPGYITGLVGRVPLQNSRLQPGGDGQSDSFIEAAIGPLGQIRFIDKHTGKRAPLVCADLLVNVKYHLDSQPNIKQTKSFRFATRNGGGGLKWVKEGVNSNGIFCKE